MILLIFPGVLTKWKIEGVTNCHGPLLTALKAGCASPKVALVGELAYDQYGGCVNVARKETKKPVI